MNREKAVRILRREIECLTHTKCSDCILEKVCDPNTTPLDSEYREIFEMAIKALEQIPDLKEAYNKGYKDGQEALAVHLELCKEEGNCDYYDSYNQTCRRSDVPKEPCEDCISREEVCDYIAEFVNHEYATDREHELVEHIIGGIQHLPSIQPKQKMVEPQESEVKE